ncbi:MAG: bifunctional 4-hydroxy-2-oxoglutarate aldolase/2-dehydro-3-deoxy-phosphogluconate aldolase [Williamsia sp.]|nr:bifunctional 4-hydroxy-2-oxoglutarate aldolase/2-dehydro-3-deoxy-phosphogluconate aldolase [Williamsia sp.]
MGNFSREEVQSKLKNAPLVPLFTHNDLAVAKEVVHACYKGGVRVFEYTNRSVNSAEVFKALLAYARQSFPDLAFGIGTIYNREQATYFAELGADFIIQPILDAGVAEVCAKHRLAWMPGTMTLTEIYTARQLGADIIKIFPAATVGPGFIKAIKGPMPDVKIMATGGVEPTRASLQTWFGAGSHCVGLGSQLVSREVLEEKNYDKLEVLVQECFDVIKVLQAETV